MNKSITMKTALAALACTACVSASAQKQYPEQEKMKPGMSEYWTPQPKVVTPGDIKTNSAPSDAIVLFDGKDLSAWQNAKGGPAEWIVKDGVFTVDKKKGDILTKQKFENFQLHIEWCVPENITGTSQGRGNSGIFLHIQRDGIWPNCYECQLWNGKAGDLIHSSGTESAELRADSTLIILPKLEPSTEKPVGEWNTAEIVCSDSTITVHVNGQLQNRLTGLSNRQGFIGLQSEGGPVQFRNIILTPLD